jgi:hypothetical protein
MPNKLQPINYTNRDFDSIRRDLENFAKRYYPSTYKDFNEASFGSLMLDTVAYVGDILSFYLDYQVNESFLDSAIEYGNVVRLARQLGFRLNTSPSAYGVLTFYIKVPASTSEDGPDLSYAPTLQVGSQFGSSGGGLYTLLENINFTNPANQMVVGTVIDDTPTSYVIRAQGRVVSGRLARETKQIGGFQRFRRVPLSTNNLAEVISVADSEGHSYVEVDNLSQNVIYKAIRNNNAQRGSVPSILKAVPVARRFTLEREGSMTFLQFGYGSDSEKLADSVADPANVVLDLHGRQYITDVDFDPTKLLDTDKFGIGPSNTLLTVSYRLNTTRDVNAATNTVVQVLSPKIKFVNQGALNNTTRIEVISSLEVTNETPITGDVSLPSSQEIKQRVISHYAAQNRAVTAQDYQAITYGMPAQFGAIKRCTVVRDFTEFKRNLNLYVISEDTATGKLLTTNSTIKINLRTWLSQYKMINDTIDIMDAFIVNYGINYVALADYESNRFTVLKNANTALSAHVARAKDIGEPIYISEIYKVLNDVPGIIDVTAVELVNKAGGRYSETSYSFKDALSSDGRVIGGPPTVIFELKYPNIDIKGSIK